MPDVGGKKFSYTPEGRKAAKAYSKRTGKAIRTNYRGGKTVAKKRNQRGGRAEPQFRTDESGRRGQAAYYGYVAPKAARKQLKKQAAAGGPGRRATRGAGGAKAGGAVKRLQGGGVTSIRGRGGPNVRPKVNVLGVGAAQAHQAAQRGGLAGQQAAAPQTRTGMTAPPQMPGRPAPRLRPGYSKGGTVSYNDLIRSKGW